MFMFEFKVQLTYFSPCFKKKTIFLDYIFRFELAE